MREKFYNDLIVELSSILSKEQLNEVSKVITIVMDSYEITERETSIVPYENIPECVKIYLVTRKIEGLSDGTLSNYKARLAKFFLTIKIPIEKITSKDILLYLYKTKEYTQCSDRTLDGIRTVISTFFRWANCEGYIPTNPCLNIKAIKYTKNKRGYLSEIELEMLRSACDNLRESAIFEILYSTGCRVTELINIKKTDINFETNEITILGKGDKYRTVYLNAKAKLAIKKYLESRNDDCEYVIVSTRKPYHKITKEMIERIVSKLGVRAGITQHVYPHLIRHTTATLGLQRGMDITNIQKMLGHERVDTTLIYAEVADKTVKEAHQKYIV